MGSAAQSLTTAIMDQAASLFDSMGSLFAIPLVIAAVGALLALVVAGIRARG